MVDTSTVLAAIWHDPPWKPWGIHARLSNGYTRITSSTGQGQRSYKDLILHALYTALKSKYAKGLLGELAKENGEEIYEEVKGYYERIVKKSGNDNDAGSHEMQAAIIPAVLAALLKASGEDRLARLSTILVEAGAKILRRDYRIRCADSLASAVDRSQLAKVAKDVAARELVLINPFDPSKKARLNPEIDALRIAWFILNYTTAIARVLKYSKTDANAERNAERLLMNASFLLLEPIWYATMGSAYRQYMPPADTRLPTHTVFDHVNAALMTLLWCQGQGGARGYLAVVDLAGVQSWIRESRALRDLWASSWIASLLAWKAIESLVEQHGPGVMVSPPARLTPFASTRLILSKLQDPHNINVKIVTPKRGQEATARNLKLYEILGLSYGWPVDPVTPSRLLIALPPHVSEDKLRETVVRGVSEAWKMILDYTLEKLRAEITKAQNVERPEEVGVAYSLIEAARKLEAPLAVRVYTVRIEDAFDEARRMSREYAEALYYGIALTMLKAEEERLKVKLPGRRSGQAYYNYAAEAHRAWRGRKATCTVCGRAPAIVDGKKLRESMEDGKIQGTIPLLHEIREDRLCPYCLSKRLLRTMLRDKYSTRLVGVKMTNEAKERLSFTSIDAYTGRITLARKTLTELAKELASQLKQSGGSCTDSLPEILKSVAGAGNRFIRASELQHMQDNCIREAESIILEVAHDKVLLDNALEELDKLNVNKDLIRKMKYTLREAYRKASVYRSKYAILQMDVDFMGAGVLSGRLGLRPEEHYRCYARWIANLEPRDTVNEFGKMYMEIANLLHEYEGQKLKSPGPGSGDVKARLRESTPTVVVTPSYHFAVSRSLAVQSLLDRRIVEDSGGMVIYAGGDDLLAILPPVDEGGDTYRYPALEAAWRARSTYWGETHAPEGFNAVWAGSSEDLVVGVAPALRAYGRSGALYIVDIAVPMWISLETAGELEESKDIIERKMIDCTPIEWYKDVLVIASDSSGAAILPLTRLEGDQVKLQDIQGSLAALLANIRIRGKQGKGVSRSIFPDYTMSVDTVYMLAKHLPRDPELAEKYVVRVIARNKEVEEIDEQGIHEGIVRHLGGGGAYTSLVCVNEDSVTGRLLASTGYGVQSCGKVCSQVVSQVFLAARILSGSL